MDQLLLLASLAEAWGPRGEALGARVPQERLSALLPRAPSRTQAMPHGDNQYNPTFTSHPPMSRSPIPRRMMKKQSAGA